MRSIRFIPSLVALGFLLASQISTAAIVRRAVIDIGSGSTKLKLADVDTDLQRVVGGSLDFSEKVDYKSNLASSPKLEFSKEIMSSGEEAIGKLMALAKENQAKKVVAVATSAFRDAKNGKKFARIIEKKFGIKVKVIDQKEEAVLGFLAGVSVSGTSPEQTVVWDIGGGSAQIVGRASGGKFDIYQGQLASVGFKNQVIEKIQGKDPGAVSTPNPMGLENAEKAVQLAEEFAGKDVPPSIRKKISVNGVSVVGIGAVHGISIKDHLKGAESYTQADLKKILQEKATWSDEKIGGKYASTDVSNVALVLGFMKALGISSVRNVKAGIADGVLVNPKYWVQ